MDNKISGKWFESTKRYSGKIPDIKHKYQSDEQLRSHLI